MKIYWLLVLSTSICAMATTEGADNNDSLAKIQQDVQRFSCDQCTKTLKRLSAVIKENNTSFENVIVTQQKLIQKLNEKLKSSETTNRRLLVATCASAIIATGFAVKELLVRNPEFVNMLHSKLQQISF